MLALLVSYTFVYPCLPNAEFLREEEWCWCGVGFIWEYWDLVDMGAANSTAKTSHHQHAVVHRGHGHRAKTYEEDRRDSGGPRTLTQPFIPVLTKVKYFQIHAFVGLNFNNSNEDDVV